MEKLRKGIKRNSTIRRNALKLKKLDEIATSRFYHKHIREKDVLE
ncbi:hypothetical protein [Candidatus Kuenenia stuttgartiensis]|nr:hypothetical protein [Candidatus Kuenenia stuttgartiensis]